jgi:hypothetical protein
MIVSKLLTNIYFDKIRYIYMYKKIYIVGASTLISKFIYLSFVWIDGTKRNGA